MSSPAPSAPSAGAGTEFSHCEIPFPVALRWAPAELVDNARILADYVAALRSIADHPAMDAARKEARLKAIADALEGGGTNDPNDDAARAALNLRHLLESHDLGIQDPWQMLQAAGQDIGKAAYADWSDLLAYCRYAAAPLGRMACRLAGGRATALAKCETLAMGAMLLYLAEQAAAHYKWLGRVYLPERWLRDAGAAKEDLSAARSSEALSRVFARQIDEAAQLIAASRGLDRGFARRRVRIGAALAQEEASRWARHLGECDLLEGADPMPRPGLGLTILGLWRGLPP